MASVLFAISGTVMNALAFSYTKFFFSKLTDHSEKECKRHGLALEKFQKGRDSMKSIDFTSKNLRQKNEATIYMNSADEAMVEYYQVFAKQMKFLPPELQPSDFYSPSEGQKNGKLLFRTYIV